ncbi:TIGR03067 domain-containing protein [Zavarzinella formosa]|uniref:TIGR03067 domain-containing protein n=1 Tax=Zavarzinella formosa TaxID=360055 RepID=UPI000302D19C|nr:TIGR03067 domain-containing protein [Zavarzinella formosa]
MHAMFVVGLILVVGAPDAKEAAPKKTVPPVLLGQWECEKATAFGQVMPIRSPMKYEFTADGKAKIIVDGKTRLTGTYKVDETKAPMEIDLTLGSADTPEFTLPGIYKVEKDVLTLCQFDAPGGKRPTEFASAAKSKNVLMTLKRVEKAKE